MPKRTTASPRRFESRVLELLPASVADRRVGDPSADVFLYLIEALIGTQQAVAFAIEAIAKLPLAGFFRRSHVAAQWLTSIRLMLDRLPGSAEDVWADATREGRVRRRGPVAFARLLVD